MSVIHHAWDISHACKSAQLGENLCDKAAYGIWTKAGIPEIRKRGFKLAFQLSEKRDPEEPLYTVRRMIIAPTSSAQGMLKVMQSTFR